MAIPIPKMYFRTVWHADYEAHNHFPECASLADLLFTVMLKNASVVPENRHCARSVLVHNFVLFGCKFFTQIQLDD